MPVITVTTVGKRLDNPSLVLDHGGTDPIHLKCAMRTVSHDGDNTFEDVETYCSPGAEAPGTTTQTLSVDLLWSFGADGTYNVLKPYEKTLTTFAFLVDGGAPVSDANPELSGSLYVPFIPFIRADGVQKFSIVPMEFRISGTPITTYTAPAVYAGHA